MNRHKLNALKQYQITVRPHGLVPIPIVLLQRSLSCHVTPDDTLLLVRAYQTKDLPTRPKSSTPSAANMKNRRKKRSARLPTSGSAWTTVLRSVLTDLAILSNLRTVEKRIFMLLVT